MVFFYCIKLNFIQYIFNSAIQNNLRVVSNGFKSKSNDMTQKFTPFSILVMLFIAGIMPAFAASITVSNSLDAGAGSFRDAIIASNSGDTIYFSPSIDGNTIFLSTGEIIIDKSLVIIGNGTSNTFLDGSNNSRILHISSAGNVSIENISFSNGFSVGSGGAILSESSDLFLENIVITNSAAMISGGALYNSLGYVSVSASAFENNIASGAASDEGGGAICNDAGNIEIKDNTTFINNTANGASGSGGAVLNDIGGSLSVQSSSFTNNSASRAGGAIEDNSGSTTTVELLNVTMQLNETGPSPGNGGGVHITGAGNMNVTDGNYSSNSAASEGGGLWNGSGVMTVSGATITMNIANGADATNGGGGIFNNGGTLIVIAGTFIDNNMAPGASGSGGGIFNELNGDLTVTNSIITNNSASRAGGGIEDNSGAATTIYLKNNDLSNNATGAAPGNGGGLHITGAGNAQISGGTVNGNSASQEGGGLWNGSGTMRVINVMISGNEANGNLADDGGGGIFNNGGILFVQNNTSITNNSANGTSGSGGGIFNNIGGSTTIINSVISSNSSSRAGGGIEDNAGNFLVINNSVLDDNLTSSNPGNGGGVHMTGAGNIRVSGSTITNNTASSEGGGLWNGTGVMIVKNSFIDNNIASGVEATNGGGGIFNNGGAVIVEENTIITNNSADGASGSGGGIFNEVNGNLTVDESIVSSNYASRAGGGLEDNSGSATTVLIRNTTMAENQTGSAPGNGGAIHITGAGNMHIETSDFYLNTAVQEGGGLWNGSGVMTVSNSSITENTATGPLTDDGGGGLFNNGGTLEIFRTTVAGNFATGLNGNGGGVHNNNGNVTITRSTISGNTSASNAGGVFNKGKIRLNANTIVNNTAMNNGGGFAQNLSTDSAAFQSNIIALNTATSGMDLSSSGTIISAGYNLIGQDDASIFAAIATDIEGTFATPTDPQIDALADNGGFGKTHALVCGSPAINTGNPSDNSDDQRGFEVFGLSRDMGSYELQEECFTPDGRLSSVLTPVIIYPNPATSDVISITLTELADVRIYEITTGKLILETKSFDGGALNISLLPAGNYLIEIVTQSSIERLSLVVI